MSFTVHDFHEMTQLFYRNPEFRAELRRLVLTDEILNLPEQIRAISKDIHELYEISKRHDARLGNLESDVAVLKSDVAVLKSDVADIKGDLLESRVRERVFAYLSRFARRLRLITDAQMADLLEGALDDGKINESEFDKINLLDFVAQGRHRDTGESLYLAGEVSYTIADKDLDRAIDRAKLLQKVTDTSVLPVVVGKVIAEVTQAKANDRGIAWTLLPDR